MSNSLDLLMESPLARAKVKYNKLKHSAVLIVTDDKKWFKYKSKDIDQIEYFLKLTSKLLLKVDPT